MIRAVFTAISVPCFAQPDYYITTVRVCQGVFQNFFKFFSTFFKPFSLTPCRADVKHIISHSVHFVKYLFKSFFNFFRDFFEAVSRGRPLVDSLHIIALPPPFVNSFLESFFGLAEEAVLYKRRAWFLYTMPKYWRFSPSNRRKSRSSPPFSRGDRSNERPPPACGSDRRKRPGRTYRRPR